MKLLPKVLAVLLSLTPLAKSQESKPPELPAHAQINGKTWTLSIVDHLAGTEIGHAYCEAHSIKLLSTIGTAREFAEILWHELMHALDDCVDTAWNNSGNEEDPDDGHTGIYTMTPRIVDLLTDNPELIRFIQYKAQGK